MNAYSIVDGKDKIVVTDNGQFAIYQTRKAAKAAMVKSDIAYAYGPGELHILVVEIIFG